VIQHRETKSDAAGSAVINGDRVQIAKLDVNSKPRAKKWRGRAVGKKVSLERTAAHEFGHSAGLYHPDSAQNTLKNLKMNNLLHQTRITDGDLIEESQINDMRKRYEKKKE